MKYEDYSLQDFLLDDSFVKWVRNPDPSTDDFWQKWIENHPKKKPLVEKAKLIVSSVRFEDTPLSEQEVQAMWHQVQMKNEAASRPVHTVPTRKLPIQSTKHWQKMAAAMAGIIFLSVITFLLFKNAGDDMITYRTAYGETQTITLPDSSTVTLNANSTLKYASAWETTSRQVWLEGEAFFSVEHTANDSKFLVHTDLVNVEVLGTKFNVRQRRGKARVVLNEGKVKLSKNQDEAAENVIMKPGELVEVTEDRAEYAKKTVNTELYTSWTDNKLIFDGTPVAEIAQLLEDNYGFEVVINDTTLATKKFKGAVAVHDIQSLLGQMSKVFQIEIEQHGQKIQMKPRER